MRRPAGFLVLLLITSHAAGQDVSAGVPFQKGRTRLSVNAGYSSFNHNNYGVIGLGAGYYFLDGLEAGVDGEAWVGAKPHIYTVSPEIRYVMAQMEPIRPYLGAFYKRTMYDVLPNADSVGGRAGVVTSASQHAYLTAGLVYESFLHCDKTVYDSCTQVYPEVGFHISY